MTLSGIVEKKRSYEVIIVVNIILIFGVALHKKNSYLMAFDAIALLLMGYFKALSSIAVTCLTFTLFVSLFWGQILQLLKFEKGIISAN